MSIDNLTCDRCDFTFEAGEEAQLRPYNETGTEWLCELCYATHTNASGGDKYIVRSMCYIGNAVIRAITNGPAPADARK